MFQNFAINSPTCFQMFVWAGFLWLGAMKSGRHQYPHHKKILCFSPPRPPAAPPPCCIFPLFLLFTDRRELSPIACPSNKLATTNRSSSWRNKSKPSSSGWSRPSRTFDHVEYSPTQRYARSSRGDAVPSTPSSVAGVPPSSQTTSVTSRTRSTSRG